MDDTLYRIPAGARVAPGTDLPSGATTPIYLDLSDEPFIAGEGDETTEALRLYRTVMDAMSEQGATALVELTAEVEGTPAHE